MHDMDPRHEIQDSAPQLAKLPAADPFRVPEGLFDVLPQRVAAAAQHPAPRVWWPQRWAVAVASLVVLCTATWFALRTTATSNDLALDLSADDAGAYAELLPWSDLHLDNTPAWDSITIAISQEEALAYLEYQGVDPYDLIPMLQP